MVISDLFISGAIFLDKNEEYRHKIQGREGFMTRWIFAIISVTLLSGCACLMKMGVNRLAPTFEKFGQTAQKGNDPELLRIGAPSNLLMLDGLIEISPENPKLLTAAAQAYCAYAQAFVEDEDVERAARIYLKGRDYGMRVLKSSISFRKKLESGERIEEAVKVLGKKYIPAIFWTGTCWAGWLNLSKRDPKALLDVPSIKGLMERVYQLDDTYYYGAPHLFFGVYYAGLPTIAGGGAEKSKVEFEKAIEITGGKNLLPYVMYAQSYATLVQERELFESLLNKVLESPSDAVPEMTLVNEVAKKRAAKLLKEADKYF